MGEAYPEVTPSFFAEFLNKGSPVHLSILNPSTCVGLRYEYYVIEVLRLFLILSPRILPGLLPTYTPQLTLGWTRITKTRIQLEKMSPINITQQFRNINLISIGYPAQSTDSP